MPLIDLSKFQQFTAINLSSDPGASGGPVVIPLCAQINILWALEDAKQGHSVLYGAYTGSFAGTVAQANGIMTALTTGASWTALAAFFPPTQGLAGITIRDVNTANQPLITSTVPFAGGTSASAALPNEVAVVITERTGKVGRAFRGRVYVPGWATNALGAGNVVAAAAITALQNWANTIPSAFTGQGYTWSIGQKKRVAYVSPKTGISYPQRDATHTVISSQPVRDNHWDSQRRRGLK